MNTGSVPRGRGRGQRPETSSTTSTTASSSGPEQGESQLAQLSPSQDEPDGTYGARRGPRSDTAVGFKEIPKQSIVEKKQGAGGTPITLMSNYFMMERVPNWELFQYHVSFNPAIDHKKVKKGVLWQKRDTFGQAAVFDGSTLTTFNQIPEDKLVSTVPDKMKPEQTFKITLTHVTTLKSGDYSFIQFYNNIVRKCLFNMGMTEVGRNFFDSNSAVEIKAHRITLWPGFVTSIRQHDGGLMLCVEGTTKVLRTDTVLKTLDEIKGRIRDREQYEAAVKKEICGSIVLSVYNNKTYTISDVDFSQNPRSTFPKKDQLVTYLDYYKDRHQQEIKDMQQPLLLVEPRKQDFHRQGPPSGPCLLIPELCKMTGLTDTMRQNFSLMKELGKYLFQSPLERVNKAMEFMKKLQTTPENKAELDSWEIKFSPTLVPCPGRILTPESIVFASTTRNPNPEKVDSKADWTNHFRTRQMLSTIRLDRWAIIVPQRDSSLVDSLVNTLKKVATPLNFQIANPIVIETIVNVNTANYSKAIKDVTSANDNLQMVFIVLATNAAPNYAAVKKAFSVTHGIPSQCFLSRNLKTPRGDGPNMSIATKVAIQMNAKLGGEPWSVPIPVKKMMVLGFDTYHGSQATGGKSVGALVASTSGTMASFFSCVSFHSDGAELARNLSANITKCLDAYKQLNNEYPEKIMLYRDGVGDGQLEFVQETEVNQLLEILDELYTKAGQGKPKLTYIIVCKKINTRLFSNNKANPVPGTVCDDVVTLPERYDFFLIPQTSRQGAVSPSSYNVIYDSQGLKPERIQAFTYKMCHLYFNWSGTVAVPAPCKYAHKLASQIGTATGAAAHDKLAFNLHYL